jgi:hypothetical protein
VASSKYSYLPNLLFLFVRYEQACTTNNRCLMIPQRADEPTVDIVLDFKWPSWLPTVFFSRVVSSLINDGDDDGIFLATK